MREIKKKVISMFMACAMLFTAGNVASTAMGEDKLLGMSEQVQAAQGNGINKKSATMYLGEKLSLTISGTTKKVNWSSSNKSVATVSSGGKVTARGKGKARITGNIAGKSYTCTVTVKNAYKVTASNKKNLTVEKGYSKVTFAQKLDDSEMKKRAAVFIPSVSDYTDGKFVAQKESYSNTDGCYITTFESAQYDDFSFVDGYVSELKKYGFTLDHHFSSSSGSVWDLTYNGQKRITKGLFDGSADGSADIEIFTYRSFAGTYVLTVSCPKEVGVTFSKSKTADKAITVATDYSVEKGKDRFRIKGWGDSSSDCLTISIYQDVCKKGKTYKLADFKSQSSAGTSGLYSVSLYSPSIAVDSPEYIELDDFQDLKVKILDKTSSTIALYYYAVVKPGLTRYTLEGLVVAYDKDAEEYTPVDDEEDSNRNSQIVIKNPCLACAGKGYTTKNCTMCAGKGTKKCIVCGAAGRIACTKCGGDGKTWDGLNGRDAICAYCYGIGRVTCDRCNGKGASLCSNCNGKKKIEKTCISCHGTGKR